MRTPTTLIEIVDDLGAHAERPALLAFAARDRREWSYGQLAKTVRELSAGLVAAGLEPGTRVALFAPDGPEWIASALAVIRAGALVVPLDAQFTDDALAHTLIDSAARIVFTTVDRADQPALARSPLALAPRGAPPRRPGQASGGGRTSPAASRRWR